jgi:DNA polymerase-3 subunit epsilon
VYLFFDTETTGLPKSYSAPVEKINNWPRLIQLAYLFYDKNQNLILKGDFIIKPDGFIIPNQATKIHGISTEKANEMGVPIKSVLNNFKELIEKSEFLVAHNMDFDEKIIGSELIRNHFINLLPTKRKICTMKSTVDFCKIYGNYGYKWPKLSELHYKLFNTHFENAHNAIHDIEITAKCFWQLRKLGKI